MKKYFLAGVSVVLALIIMKQSLVLRFFNYETYPVPNLDEYNYLWQAVSLKQTGLPMAWTLNLGEYKNQKYHPVSGGINGFNINSMYRDEFQITKQPLNAVYEMDYGKGKEQISFVVPFFDHPPLGGLMYSLSLPHNLTAIDEVKPADFRKSAIFMAVITGILLYILLWLIYGNPWVPLLTVLIYSTVPTYILATRTTYLENAISPWIIFSLINLYLAIRLHDQKKWQMMNFLLIFSGISGGLSVLVKEPAAGFLIGFGLLLIIHKLSIKSIAWFIFAAVVPILLYIGWGVWLQRDLFWGIFLTNTGRDYFGAIKMVTQLEALKFKNFPVDGWWVWGFISFLVISLTKKTKKILFITLPLLTHLLTVLLMPSPNYPWYLIACIPFLAATSAVFIWQIIKKPNWASGMVFFLIPFSSSYYWGREALNLTPSISHYRIIFLIFSLILFIRIKWSKQKLIKYIWTMFLAYILYRIYIYNLVSFPYLMAHWGSLPVPSLPNF